MCSWAFCFPFLESLRYQVCLTLCWQVPRTTDSRPLLSVNQARSFPRECQAACSCSQSAVTSPKSSRGSRNREPPQGTAGGFSSANAAPLRGRPQSAPTAARPQPATSSSLPSRKARATTCQREPAKRLASSSPTTTSRSRSESGRASPRAQNSCHRRQVGVDRGDWDRHFCRVGRYEGVSIALPV